MAVQTKAMLQAAIETLQAQVVALQAQLASVTAVAESALAALAKQPVRVPAPVRAPRPAYVAPAWQADRAQAMAAAKAAAMAGRCMVRV